MDATPGGHIVIRSQAFRSVFAALAARTLGVKAGAVTVRVADEKGLLRVDIRAPHADRSRSIIEAAGRVQDVVREEGRALTGAQVDIVRVRIDDVIAPQQRRLA